MKWFPRPSLGLLMFHSAMVGFWLTRLGYEGFTWLRCFGVIWSVLFVALEYADLRRVRVAA